ncbi:MAG: hypothetical protein UT43_C0012G0003 [Parcubacteria group bacterium GW2011_GWC1_39_29]|nr:MAG: hypothetical protein UT43_C0012G0003 [Parcubacteria group bacterium GW2011_GWC1_39_29]
MAPETARSGDLKPESSSVVEKKSGPEAYLEALQSKKDVLDAFYEMNAFRRTRGAGDFTPDDKAKYGILKQIWMEKKRQNIDIVDQLDPATLSKILSFGMDVHSVGAELTLLKFQKDSSVAVDSTETVDMIPASGLETPPLVPPAQSSPSPDAPLVAPHSVFEPSIPAFNDDGSIAESNSGFSSGVSKNESVSSAPSVAPETTPQNVNSNERELALTTERLKERMKNEKIANLKIELAEVGPKLDLERSKIYGSDIERRGQAAEIKELENRKKEIEAEIELLEKGALGVFRDRVGSAYRKTVEAIKGDPTKKTKWGWVKERLKGFATAGVWEVIVAERVRDSSNSGSGTFEASKNQVNVDRADTADETEDYAWKLQREAKNKGSTLAEIDKKHEADNNLFIENQANQAVEDVMSRVKNGKGESGQYMDTPENRAAIKAEVISELTKIRQGKASKSEAEMQKFIRATLDDKWSRRYIYAGIEAVLLATGAIVATVALTPETIALPALPGHPELFKSIPPGLESQYVNMSNTIWETVSHMFPGASDAVIMAKSKVLMATNHIFEPEWATKLLGEISSRALPQGLLLKLPAGFIS